jgi:hypothetical protein
MALTRNLTTYRLELLGRRWTIQRESPWMQGQFGHPLMSLDGALSAPQSQVAGSCPVPPTGIQVARHGDRGQLAW